MRVLVVEDEAALRDALKARLTEAGFTVDAAADGNEGLFAGLEYPLTSPSSTSACRDSPGSR